MLEGKYNYTEKEKDELFDSIVILVDTQEKKNQHITDYFEKHGIKYKNKRLDHGDYSFYIPKNESLGIVRDTYFCEEVFVERKNSLDELSQNFAKGRADFKEEFATTKAKKRYLMVEDSSYSDILDGNYTSKYNKNSFIGSLHSFNVELNMEANFVNKKDSGAFIYNCMKYYLRNLIK